MSFAEKTSVPVFKSRMEIEVMLHKAGATHVAVMTEPKQAQVAFVISGWRVLFRMPLPERTEHRFTHIDKWRVRADTAAEKLWEQACRTAWRALMLTVKAKFVSVENRVESFEEAFMAHLVSKGGETLGDQILPQLREERKLLGPGSP